MNTFEIWVLVGLAVNAGLLWEIRVAARRTHDAIVDIKIERMELGPELKRLETLLSMIEHNTDSRIKRGEHKPVEKPE